MEKSKVFFGVLAAGLAVSLVGNVYLWNSLNQKDTEYIAAMANLEEELAQNKEAQDTLRQQLEQTKADLEQAESQQEIPVDAPVWIIDPNTGLPILAPGNGDPSIDEDELQQEPEGPGISEGAQKELEDLLNGNGNGNGNGGQGGNGGNTGNNGGNGNKGTLDISDFNLPDGAVTSDEGHTGGGGDTSGVPNYNPFA